MQDRGGQVFRVNQQDPYSGNVIHNNPSGSLLWKAQIDQGWVSRLTAFHPDGNTYFDCGFKQAPHRVMGQSWEHLLQQHPDLLSGEFHVYHPEGTLKLSIHFEDGRPEGVSRFLYANGNPEQIANFKTDGPARIERFAEEGWKVLEINLCEAKLSDLFTDTNRLRGLCARRMHGEYFLMHNEHTMAERGIFKCGMEATQFESWSEDGINLSQAVSGQPFTIGFLNNAGDIRMIWVPPGSFGMGTPLDEVGREDDETLHSVTLKDGFWLAAHEITQEQWQDVMGNNPSYFEGDPTLPVESIKWAEAMEFCRRLTARSRLMNLIPEGFAYSLPTEAQWEYACRAGTSTPFSGDVDAVAWYHQNSKHKPHPVGTKQCNDWGFYDMHGNVWEMCLDWERNYPEEPETDPLAVRPAKYKVVRGASWAHLEAHIRSANRGMITPGTSGFHHGMRMALIPVYYHQRLEAGRYMTPTP